MRVGWDVVRDSRWGQTGEPSHSFVEKKFEDELGLARTGSQKHIKEGKALQLSGRSDPWDCLLRRGLPRHLRKKIVQEGKETMLNGVGKTFDTST